MGFATKKSILKRNINANKYCKEVLNILKHQRNTNFVKILSYLARMTTNAGKVVGKA